MSTKRKKSLIVIRSAGDSWRFRKAFPDYDVHGLYDAASGRQWDRIVMTCAPGTDMKDAAQIERWRTRLPPGGEFFHFELEGGSGDKIACLNAMNAKLRIEANSWREMAEQAKAIAISGEFAANTARSQIAPISAALDEMASKLLIDKALENGATRDTMIDARIPLGLLADAWNAVAAIRKDRKE